MATVLTPKPWRLEAIVRLLASVFISICAGSLIAGGLHFFRDTHPTRGAIARFVVLGSLALCAMAVSVYMLRRAWEFEGIRRRVVLFLGWFYAGILLGALAQKLAGRGNPSIAQLVIGTLFFQGASLALLPGFLREHRVGLMEAFGLAQRSSRAVLWGVLAAGIFLPMSQWIWWGASELLKRLHLIGVEPAEQQVVAVLRNADSLPAQVLLGAVTILLAPIAEELVFRGVLYPAIRDRGHPQIALWATSLLFASMHVNAAAFLPLLALSLVLTVLYRATGNLLAPIIAHALFNAENFLKVYLQHA